MQLRGDQRAKSLDCLWSDRAAAIGNLSLDEIDVGFNGSLLSGDIGELGCDLRIIGIADAIANEFYHLGAFTIKIGKSCA
ncbi:hypothetical protein [Qipengyuania flava]|uniref:hypothetical protein n=1 Tax=Qipengyuania flava TaxID=192812 RepID=UPI001CFEAFF4|nr:hypothetical protein [Qipengyuania flava]